MSILGSYRLRARRQRLLARAFLRRAVEALAALPDSVHRRSLQGICEFTVQRTH